MSFWNTIEQDLSAVQRWFNSNPIGAIIEADFRAAVADLEKISAAELENAVKVIGLICPTCQPINAGVHDKSATKAWASATWGLVDVFWCVVRWAGKSSLSWRHGLARSSSTNRAKGRFAQPILN